MGVELSLKTQIQTGNFQKMEDVMRKPLAPRSNMSRLPQPGVRMKRARSPDESEAIVSGKKTRVDSNDKTSTGNTSTKSSSTSSLLSISSIKPTANGRINRAVSSSNLGRQPGGTGINRTISTVKATRNSKIQPRGVSSTVIKPKPTSTVIGKPAALNNSVMNTTVNTTGGPKKRPAWDLKGRIQDMESQFRKQEEDKTSFMTQFYKSSEMIGQLEKQNHQLSTQAAQKEIANESTMKEIQNLKNKLCQTEEQLATVNKKFQVEMENLEFQKSSLERHKLTLEGELNASVKEVSALKGAIAELTASQSTLQGFLDNTKLQLNKALADISERNTTIAEKAETIRQMSANIELYQQRERDHETERRKLHNTIQELKGNIRVFCRVRPLLEDEQLGNNGTISHMNFPDLDLKVLELDKLPEISVNESVLNSTRGAKNLSKYEFSFDRVFQPESTQAEVFEEISQLIQSALDGYNVCIFAYGQTGSGKTFTMEGALSDETTLGMIPRTVQQIFRTTADLQRKGWEYTFHVSMLEIYNETIRDLLSKGKDDKLEIKIQGKGDSEVHVPNLTVVDVKAENQVFSLLKTASKNRAVAETKCNDRSSRSHSVFQMRLAGSNSITGESSKGMLNLVDLAGSERVKESGSEGQRLVEAQSINKSLSNLGNVIMALGKKEKHIPYRNSKLTYLLQNSLGGNSKTLMFVNVSPKEECFSETLNSLRFATKVNQCNIGTAQKKK